MAIVVANGDVMSVRLGYGIVGSVDNAFNVLHYSIGGSTGTPPGIVAALGVIAQAMFTKWYALWKVSAGTDVEMEGVQVSSTFPAPRSVSGTYVPGASSPGTVTGEALPLQDAPTLLKTTAIGARWGMGRLFYVGLAESLQDSGLVTAGGQVTLQAMGAALADTVVVTSGGWTANLYPVLLTGPDTAPTRITPVTGGRLSGPVIKGQRRRRPGKGT